MTLTHKIVLYGALGLLGLGLVIPGLLELLRAKTGSSFLVAENTEARNHLRALHGMMAGMGAAALLVCLNLEAMRWPVIGLGIIMAGVVSGRVYSIVIDGNPGATSLFYLATDVGFAALFLLWPPPAG